jgi:hypothetical protein
VSRRYPQLTGRFRRWWQVMGSNQRSLSRRYYRSPSIHRYLARDLRILRGRRREGPLSVRPASVAGQVRWSAHRPYWIMTREVQLPATSQFSLVTLAIPERGRVGAPCARVRHERPKRS